MERMFASIVGMTIWKMRIMMNPNMMISGKHICPNCESDQVIAKLTSGTIVYGRIAFENTLYQCKECGHHWIERTKG